MTTYKLIDAITDRQRIQIVQRKNKVIQYSVATLEPGKLYEAEKDDLFINSLRNAKVSKRYSEQVEAELKAQGIEYKIEESRCCGGRRKTLTYCIVEVI